MESTALWACDPEHSYALREYAMPLAPLMEVEAARNTTPGLSAVRKSLLRLLQ
jgi:hypothetical protein